MTTLKLLQEEQKNKCEPSKASTNRSIQKNDDLIDLFPLPKYFQVHFQHIHDNTHDVQDKLNHLNHDLQNQLDQLKQALAQVEGKLDRFIAILDHRIEPGH